MRTRRVPRIVLLAGLAAVVDSSLTLDAAQTAQYGTRPAGTIVPTDVADSLGGATRLRGVRTLVCGGTYWTSQAVSYEATGNRVVELADPIEFQMALPDRVSRVEVIRPPGHGSTASFRTRSGFVGGMLITERPIPPADAAKLVADQQQTVTRLLAGAIGRFDTWPEIRLSRESATRLRVVGAGGFEAALEIDPVNHLPVRLTYRAHLSVLPPGRLFPRSQAPEASARSSVADEVEVSMRFSDRRWIDGVNFPFRITTSAKGVDLNELRFDGVQINVPIDAAEFATTR